MSNRAKKLQDKWDDYSIVERQMKRLKLTFSITVHKDLLDRIRDANTDLESFTQHNITVEPKRKRLSKRPIANLKLIRKHAASLYQVFMTDKAWKCICNRCHMPSLRLEARPQTIEDVKAEISQRYIFRILLSMVEAIDKTRATLHWKEIEVISSLESQFAVDALQTPSRVLR